MMSEMGELWRSWNSITKYKRKQNLANADSAGWEKHTEYHWSRRLNGKRLDYWPSHNKFMYEGRVMTGDVVGFIKKREKHE